MLAEIAAANAAFAVIKSAIQNGREIADVAHKVGDYVNATEDLRKKGEKRKRRTGGADLEEFTHLTNCLLYTSPSPRDGLLSRMPSSA